MKAKTYEPKFAKVVDIRCEDCEINGHLSNEGLPRKGAPTNRCSRCKGRGRIKLVTWEMLRANPRLIEILSKPGARLALRRELIDPYAIAKKG